MADAKRTVKAVVTSYKHPDGTVRTALRGDEIEVAASDVKRFDAGEDEVPEIQQH